MNPIPDELLQPLVSFAEANQLGLMQITGNTVNIIVFGDNNYSEAEIGVRAAHALLDGLVNPMRVERIPIDKEEWKN